MMSKKLYKKNALRGDFMNILVSQMLEISKFRRSYAIKT
jgi:hypothetical protein